MYPVSILYKSIAGRYRPVRVADGPITARYRFIKNASWIISFRLFDDNDTGVEEDHGVCKDNLYQSFFFFYFHIQSNHPKYTILLISTAKLLELYLLINVCIKTDKHT